MLLNSSLLNVSKEVNEDIWNLSFFFFLFEEIEMEVDSIRSWSSHRRDSTAPPLGKTAEFSRLEVVQEDRPYSTDRNALWEFGDDEGWEGVDLWMETWSIALDLCRNCTHAPYLFSFLASGQYWDVLNVILFLLPICI